MNVVHREKHLTQKINSKQKYELIRKDTSSIGIRGATIPSFPFNCNRIQNGRLNNAPRYEFNGSSTTKRSSMGPPLEPPKSSKRKFISTSSSTRLESSSSDKQRQRVLASDSAVPSTSQDFTTPRNRPSALRYISSSSRGGYSGNRSARSTSTSAVEASVILAISEGRGMARGEIGIAAVDLRHPHLVLCQFSDSLLYTHTLTKINYFNPVEIIVPHTFCEGVQPNQLYQLIRDHYPLINLTTVQRRHFNDAAGRQQIQTLCAPQYSAVYLQVLQKFYALTAAAAVLKYVEYIQCVVYAKESLKIEYHSSENTMIIDVGTAVQLELVQPLVPSAGPTCCLLGILGPTFTIGGIRALRAAILQPSFKKEFIENRLDAVQDLIENDTGLMTSLQDVIKKLSDVDRILFLCVETPNQNMDKFGEAQLNQILLLKTTMDMVPKIIEALTGAECGKLKKMKMDFENPHYKEISERIRSIIQDDAHPEKGAMGSLQRCFAVKPEINGLLDVARRTYSELIDDIQKIVEQLSESYDLPLKLNQNLLKGFHIVLPIAPKNRRSFSVDDLPPIFIQVQNSGASVSMTTEELVVLDQQAKETLNEIQKMSNIVVSGLLKELRPFMSSLYKLCENVAELDILLALAQASTIGSYIRPEFDSYLDIRNSVHPLLDFNSQTMPVPNDIFATPEFNFTLITGPNMGGKSIYIKQIAIMQIMAQLGCFIPATKATLRLCDRVYSRIGFNDSVELNASTFVLEMKEMQHILRGLTPHSLVIIDELCRGTNIEEGTSMAWAICEELIASDAFTFFTTHFQYLTKLQDVYFNVVNRHTAVIEEETQNNQQTQKRLVYQHKIEEGSTKVEHYGLSLAAKTYLPENTVNLGKELSEIISKGVQLQSATIRTPEFNEDELLYKLNAQVRQECRKFGNSDESIKKVLDNFKKQHPQLIERLKARRTSTDVTDISIPSSEIHDRNQITDNTCDQGIVPPINRKRRTFDNSTDTDQQANQISLREKTPQNIYRENRESDEGENRMTLTTSEPRVRKAPYASSLDDEDNNNNYTFVKSSTELLVTLGNVDYEEQNDERSDDQVEYNTNPNQSKNLDNVESSGSNSFVNESNDIIVVNDINNNITSDKDEDKNENSIQTVEDTSFDNSDANSDLANALTQVLEECDLEHTDSDKSDNNLSDDELAEETILEIRKELNSMQDSIENIVLTPPFSFRD